VFDNLHTPTFGRVSLGIRPMRSHSSLQTRRGNPHREEIDMTPTAGILGAGTVGKAVARFFLAAGRNVVISNSRGPDSLSEVIAQLGTGAEAGTSAQAAQAPLVVLATPWTAVESTLAALPPWSGNTLVDATNAIKVYDPPTVELFDFGDRTSSEVVASLAPGASVIKAFNHIPFTRLLSPVPDGEQHVLFVSGDDTAAKAGLRSVLEANNFAVIDLGDLATGSRIQQTGGPLGGLDLRLSVAG
jgi:predicted dinucleotide-binding enzyme